MALLGSALFLFNPAVWYNSSVWGQYDSVINFFVLLAFYFLFQKKLVRAVLALFLSIYIKASLLIFVPVFLVVALKQKYKVKKYILSVAFSLLLISIVTYPFSRGEPFGWLYYLYKDKIFKNQLQVITANAFNIWAGLTGINEQPHTLTLGPLTYQVWGIILYVTSYIPVLYLVIKDKRPTNVFWALAIVAFSSFSLLTNMHERYLYPIFPVFSIIAVANPGLLPVYAFISVLNLINMYHIWWYPRVEFVVEAFSAYDKLLPRILGFVGFGLFVYLYLRFLRHLRNA
jgi:Gpi18-like mannosyltransferase